MGWGFYILLHVATETPQGENLAALLKRAMDETGMTQSDIAEKSGVPLATLNAWITGRRKPSKTQRTADYLREVAGALPGAYSVGDVFKAAGRAVPGPLTPDGEARVLQIYRNLSPGRKMLADKMLDTLASEEQPS